MRLLKERKKTTGSVLMKLSEKLTWNLQFLTYNSTSASFCYEYGRLLFWQWQRKKHIINVSFLDNRKKQNFTSFGKWWIFDYFQIQNASPQVPFKTFSYQLWMVFNVTFQQSPRAAGITCADTSFQGGNEMVTMWSGSFPPSSTHSQIPCPPADLTL